MHRRGGLGYCKPRLCLILRRRWLINCVCLSSLLRSLPLLGFTWRDDRFRGGCSFLWVRTRRGHLDQVGWGLWTFGDCPEAHTDREREWSIIFSSFFVRASSFERLFCVRLLRTYPILAASYSIFSYRPFILVIVRSIPFLRAKFFVALFFAIFIYVSASQISRSSFLRKYPSSRTTSKRWV